MTHRRRYLTGKQRKAVILLANGMTESEVADEIGVSEFAVKSWIKHNELFKTEYDRRVERDYGIDSESRKRRAQGMLGALYREFAIRQANGNFSGLSDRDLVKAISLVSHELRLDTPGDVTAKTEHSHKLNDLQDRYNKSRSGKMFQEARPVEKDDRLGSIVRKPKVVTNATEN